MRSGSEPRRAEAPAHAAALLLAAPLPAAAHSFGALYTLPVPVWMYLYGASAALALSFLMIGWFVTTPADAQRNFRTSAWRPVRAPRLSGDLRLLSVALLLLAIASGLFGSGNSYSNFNMTFFWIVILLGYAYCTALLGDSYGLLNPWQGIARAIEWFAAGAFSGRRAYPARLAYYPALALYAALVWLELFGKTGPFSLSIMLLVYTLLSLAGAWWWGAAAWFRYCDLFGVLFRVIGRIAPLEWSQRRVRVRQPFIGLLDEPCEHASLLLFILFMLSSTAFDGLHATEPWRNLSRAVMAASQPLPMPVVHLAFQSLALLASPLLYLGVYAALLALARPLARSALPLRQLCLEFAGSLVPIAFAYNVAHYFTLALGQGPRIFRLLSDPFGFGWNLFGTHGWFAAPVLLPAGTIWHLQVALILGGHIASVYLSHLVALRLFADGRAALLSQLPLLLMMVLYTTSGLWILSLPIQAG